MVIRQRRTMIDPILLDVVCPFLRAKGLDRFFPVGRVWNYSVGSGARPAAAKQGRRGATLPVAKEARLNLAAPTAQDLVHQKS
jgi:hypothetical protein